MFFIALFSSQRLGFILILSHIISCLLVGFLFRNWKKDNFKIDYKLFKTDEEKLIRISDFGEILGDAIKNAISTILTIGGFVVFFSVILSILETSGIFDIISISLEKLGIPEYFSKSLFSGMIELTNGVKSSSDFFSTNSVSSILLTSFLLGFGGCSVLLQVFSIITKEGISIKPYFYGKFLQGILSVLITWLLI